MAIQARLETLISRHKQLEDDLSDALNAPSVDDLLITEFKRQKLQLKDEIEALKQQLDLATRQPA